MYRTISSLRPFLFSVALILSLLSIPAQAQTQRKYPGRGAVSSQDLSKLISPAAAGTTAADQVCARYTSGSTIADPPVLQSQNGVLETTIGFYTVTDSQGLVRYCYVTTAGVEAPTLVRRWHNKLLGVLAILAIAFTAIGCGSSSKVDPGTAKGTYTVIVTGTASNGASQYQTSVNVPITLQ